MLTAEQKAQLRASVSELVTEALKSGITPLIQEEIKKATEVARADEAEYMAKILRNSRERDVVNKEGVGGIAIARIAACVALAKNDTEKAISIAKSRYTDDLGDVVIRTMQSGSESDGGVFVPSNLANEFIDALRAIAAVRNAGPRSIDLTGGNLTVPRIVTDATAGWVGEGKGRNASSPTTGDLVFSSKTIQAKSPMTQALLRRAGQNAEQIMRDNMLQAMANAEDIALLEGEGTQYTPKGMLNWAATTFDATQAGASATLDELGNDLRIAISNLTDANVPLTNARWFESMRSRNYQAFSIRTTTGDYVFRGELTAAAPTLLGQRVHFTNNIPNNLGAGSNESRVYLANMNGAWLAEEGGLRIRASNEASFTDKDGNMVSAFDLGLMVVIIERDEDFAMAHDEDVTVIEAVKWGA